MNEHIEIELSAQVCSSIHLHYTHCTIWWIDEISRTLSETNELHRIENVINNSNSNRCQGILWQSFDTKFHQTEIFELACFWKNLLYTFIVSKKKALILVHLVYQVAEILEKCQYKERENLTTSSNLWRQVLFPNIVSVVLCVCVWNADPGKCRYSTYLQCEKSDRTVREKRTQNRDFTIVSIEFRSILRQRKFRVTLRQQVRMRKQTKTEIRRETKSTIFSPMTENRIYKCIKLCFWRQCRYLLFHLNHLSWGISPSNSLL